MERTAALCGGRVSEGTLTIGFDESWKPLAGQGGEVHRLLLTAEPAEGYFAASLRVERQGIPAPLFSCELAALEVAS